MPRLQEWVRANFRIIIVVIIALAMRVCSTGWTQLERDEAQCVGLANDPNLFHWLSMMPTTDSNAPLWHILIWPFLTIFSGQILPLKVVCVTIGTVLPAVAYRLFNKSLGEIPTLHYCLLLALSPILIRNGELIRCYGLLHIIMLVATMTLLKFVTDPKSNFLKYVFLLTSALYLHLFSLTMFAGHGLTMLIKLVQRRISMKIFLTWAAAIALIFALFAPWLSTVVWQIGHNLNPWQRHVDLVSLVALNLHNMFFDGFHVLSHSLALLLCWSLCIYGAGLKRSSFDGFAWFSVLIGGLIGSLILHQFGMPYRDRYLSILVPISLLAFALGSARLADHAAQKSKTMRSIILSLAILPTIVLISSWFGDLHILFSMPESSFANAYSDCEKQISKDKDLVVVGMEVFAPEAYRVLPRDIRVVSFPDSEPLKYVIWKNLDSRMKDDGRMLQLQTAIKETLLRGGTIWFVDNLQPEIPMPPIDFNDLQIARANEIRAWLKAHAHETKRQNLSRTRAGSSFNSVRTRDLESIAANSKVI